jgi:hypothetical protein
VDLSIVVSTAIGAAIALLGTVLGDSLRNRGSRDRDSRSDRRTGYLEFLLALDKTHAGLRDLAATPDASDDLVRDTRRVLNDNLFYASRERLIMSANPGVVRAGERAFRALLAVRGVIRHGAILDSSEYHDAYHAYARALWDLRRAIRVDLNVSDITPEDLDKPTWESRDTCAFCQAQPPRPE